MRRCNRQRLKGEEPSRNGLTSRQQDREARSLACSAKHYQISGMATPILDFSHLTPEERIELAEQLWDSLDPQNIATTADQVAELRRRRAELASDGNLGEPGDQVLDDIAERGE